MIPGTDILTNVATIKPAFKILSHIFVDLRRARFDGSVRNATIRIKHVRFDDRAGWTGIDAQSARAALVSDFPIVVFELEIKQQLAKKNPRAVLACDQS